MLHGWSGPRQGAFPRHVCKENMSGWGQKNWRKRGRLLICPWETALLRRPTRRLLCGAQMTFSTSHQVTAKSFWQQRGAHIRCEGEAHSEHSAPHGPALWETDVGAKWDRPWQGGVFFSLRYKSHRVWQLHCLNIIPKFNVAFHNCPLFTALQPCWFWWREQLLLAEVAEFYILISAQRWCFLDNMQAMHHWHREQRFVGVSMLMLSYWN